MRLSAAHSEPVLSKQHHAFGLTDNCHSDLFKPVILVRFYTFCVFNTVCGLHYERLLYVFIVLVHNGSKRDFGLMMSSIWVEDATPPLANVQGLCYVTCYWTPGRF